MSQIWIYLGKVGCPLFVFLKQVNDLIVYGKSFTCMILENMILEIHGTLYKNLFKYIT